MAGGQLPVSMPRYFFNLKDGKVTADDVGMMLPDLQEARRHARIVANELARGGDGTREFEIIITDKSGKPLGSVIGVG